MQHVIYSALFCYITKVVHNINVCYITYLNLPDGDFRKFSKEHLVSQVFASVA